MKKWLTILLILITAAGTFIPCCFVDECCAEQSAATNHNDHQDEGTCSPFFACATCPGSVELAKAIQLPAPEMEKVIHHQPSLKFSLPAYFSSFWQPPRAA